MLDELRWNVPAGHPATKAGMAADTPAHTAHDVATDASPFLEVFGFDPFSLDELVTRTDLTVERAAVLLLELELQGLIASMPGGRYQRQPPPSAGNGP